MLELKRDVIKYIRDKAKARYRKGTSCYICGSQENLDFHHFYTLTALLRKWISETDYVPEDVMDFRDEFIAKHEAELYDHAVTLCHEHHMKLHSVYGKDPNLGTAKKQMRWAKIQREKYE